MCTWWFLRLRHATGGPTPRKACGSRPAVGSVRPWHGWRTGVSTRREEVGAPRAVDAIGDAVRAARYDRIVVATGPPGPERWLGIDLRSRLRRAGIRFTDVVAGPERTARARPVGLRLAAPA
jgi:hypothetical protein